MLAINGSDLQERARRLFERKDIIESAEYRTLLEAYQSRISRGDVEHLVNLLPIKESFPAHLHFVDLSNPELADRAVANILSRPDVAILLAFAQQSERQLLIWPTVEKVFYYWSQRTVRLLNYWPIVVTDGTGFAITSGNAFGIAGHIAELMSWPKAIVEMSRTLSGTGYYWLYWQPERTRWELALAEVLRYHSFYSEVATINGIAIANQWLIRPVVGSPQFDVYFTAQTLEGEAVFNDALTWAANLWYFTPDTLHGWYFEPWIQKTGRNGISLTHIRDLVDLLMNRRFELSAIESFADLFIRVFDRYGSASGNPEWDRMSRFYDYYWERALSTLTSLTNWKQSIAVYLSVLLIPYMRRLDRPLNQQTYRFLIRAVEVGIQRKYWRQRWAMYPLMSGINFDTRPFNAIRQKMAPMITHHNPQVQNIDYMTRELAISFHKCLKFAARLVSDVYAIPGGIQIPDDFYGYPMMGPEVGHRFDRTEDVGPINDYEVRARTMDYGLYRD